MFVKTKVYECLAGPSPPTQLAVCQMRHRQDHALSALCALAGSCTASVSQIALPTRAVFLKNYYGIERRTWLTFHWPYQNGS